MASSPSSSQRFVEVQRLLERPSKGYANPQMFQADPALFPAIRENVKVLVIGAGGLGCELLKDLALTGFKHIHVIDMDTIDLSNLNRQFLFRKSDIGKPKAIAAANFINKRVQGCQVVAHYNRIEDFDADFYRQFTLVVSGLDSVTARRWINNMLVSLLEFDQETGQAFPSSVKPLVDGGTEAFKGSVRVIYPGLSACVECTLDLYPPQVTYPLCTIANTPRLPEHCIEWAKILAWPKEEPFGEGVAVDGDDPNHITWLERKAKERASEFNIQGITYRLTQGVVKNIIPAVASTNAVIAALCTTEVLKMVSCCSFPLNNWLNFNDNEGVYTISYEQEKNPDCVVCSGKPRFIKLSSSTKLKDLLTILKEDPSYQMSDPSVSLSFGADSRKNLWMRNIPGLDGNFSKLLLDLGMSQSGGTLEITDKSYPGKVTLLVEFNDLES